MKIRFYKIFLITLILILPLVIVVKIYADELSEIEKKLADLKGALQMSINATTPLEKNLGLLQKNLQDIQNRTVMIASDLVKKEKEVAEGEKLLIVAEDLLSQKVKKLYKSASQYGSYGLASLLSQNLGEAIRHFGYQKAVINSDKDTIVKVVMYVKDLEEKKKKLEDEKIRLAKIKAETDVQAVFLQKEIGGAKNYQSQLRQTIATLTNRQRQLLAEKLSSLNLPSSLGAGPLVCVDDRTLDPGFRPAFAFFTYGIPHRVGLNQYGAYGRAKAGQNYRDILNAYYANISFEKKDPHMKIKVQGYGEKDLDDYLLGIYEMPGNWPIDALKAQVVAARSYALSYTNNGQGEICTTQACQVYKGGNKGGDWEKAVHDTEGEVADIVNVLMLAKKDSSVQSHLSQTDKPNPDGVETWNTDRVKQELRTRGGSPYNSVSNFSMDWDKGSGKTTSIRVEGDAGSNSFDADEFKNFFNLRAPANIQIVGPLYNIERK